jgi:hypothetical protein
MELTTFIVSVFCLLDDWLAGQHLRQRGPKPTLADSEALTIECVGEFLGIDTDIGRGAPPSEHSGWSGGPSYPSEPDHNPGVGMRPGSWPGPSCGGSSLPGLNASPVGWRWAPRPPSNLRSGVSTGSGHRPKQAGYDPRLAWKQAGRPPPKHEQDKEACDAGRPVGY